MKTKSRPHPRRTPRLTLFPNYDRLETRQMLAGDSTSDLVRNGNFETGNLTPFWTSAGAIDLAPASVFRAAGGKNSFPLGNFAVGFGGGGSPPTGTISQTLTTIPGIRYNLSFDYGAFGYPPPFPQSLLVTATDPNTAQVFFSETVSDSSPTLDLNSLFNRFQFNFTAVSGSTLLRFQDTSSGDGGVDGVLDNVLLLTPNLNPINDIAINEDALRRTVNLSGITASSASSLPLRVSATSNNTALIPNPSVKYNSPDQTGTIRFTPVANKSGSASITVIVEDGGFDANLATTGDNATFSRTFTVKVNPVNDPPFIGGIGGLQYYKKNSAPAFIATEATLSDVDNASFNGGKLTVRIVEGANKGNRLQIGGGFGIDAIGRVWRQGHQVASRNSGGGFDFTNLEITFNANATSAIVQELIRSVQFQTVKGKGRTIRNIEFQLSDGAGGISNTLSKQITFKKIR